MKKALIVIAVLVLLLIGGLVYLASNANSLIAQYKPDLERIASDALGSQVSLGKLEASVFPSAKVHVDEFRIASDAQSKDGLTLKNLILHIRLLPLLSGKLSIVKLGLDSPSLTFIKDSSGVSIEGLPKKPKDAAAPSQPAPAAEPAASTTGSKTGPVPAGLGLDLEKFELRNATLTFKDVQVQKEYRATNINVDAGLGFENNVVLVKSLSVTGTAMNSIPFEVTSQPIRFSLAENTFDIAKLSATALGGTLHVTAQGNVQAMNGKAQISSSGYDLSKLAAAHEFVPALKQFPLEGTVTPSIEASWGPNGSYNAQGVVNLKGVGAKAGEIVVSALNGAINLAANQSAQNVTAKGLSMKIGPEDAQLSFDAKLAGNQAALEQLQLSAFGGTVDAGTSLNLANQNFSAQYTLKAIEIGRALGVLKPALAALIGGTVENIDGKIGGVLGPNLMPSLTGSTSVLIKDGALKGINIAADVLRAVKGLPFLSGSLFESTPPGDRAALEASDTPIKSLSGNFSIANAALSTRDFKLLSSLFSLGADGSIGFDTKVDLNAQVAFNETLSAALVQKTKELKALQNAQGHLVIPLMLQGTPPKLLVLPDIQRLTELAAQAAVKEGAGKLLDKVLKGGNKEQGGKKGLGGLLGF